ncbi:MAG: TAXI family TRAP transporter solute-binding subunit [Candidatus Nezhaarchaeales archaeon]
MPKINKKILAAIIAVIVIVAAVAAYVVTPLAPPTAPAPPPTPTKPELTGKVSWVIGTSDPGSVGYIAHATIADVLTRAYPENFEITISVVGGAAAGHAAWDAGKCDIGYTAMNIVYQYVTKTGRWDPAKMVAKRYDEMTVIVYQYPLIYTLFVTEDLRDKVTCWSDLKKLGKDIGVYATPAGYASHEVFREAFSILFDCKPEDLDKILNIDASGVAAVPDLLVMGKVKAVWGYGDPGGPASWVSDAFARYGYKLVAVPPSKDELDKILSESPDLIKFKMDLTPYNVKTRTGETSLDTIAVGFGLVGSKYLSKDHIAAFFEAHIINAKDLEATGIATFKNYGEWFLEFCVECFKKQSTFGATIHPGVAEVLKKYGYDPDKLGILVAKL